MKILCFEIKYVGFASCAERLHNALQKRAEKHVPWTLTVTGEGLVENGVVVDQIVLELDVIILQKGMLNNFT